MTCEIVKINNIEECDLLSQRLVKLGWVWNSSGLCLSERPISYICNIFPMVILIYSNKTITFSTSCDEYPYIEFEEYHHTVIIKDKLKEFLYEG